MDDIGYAAIAAMGLDGHEWAAHWLAVLAEVEREFPADQDWDAFTAALYTRSRDAGVRDDQVENFLRQAADGGDPAGVVAGICADPALPPEEPAYDEAAWWAFLAENGPRWDGTSDTWAQFREWFSCTARENGLQAPADQLLEHLEGVENRIEVMAAYGVRIDPLDPYPLLARMASYPATVDGMRRFVIDETGVDPVTNPERIPHLESL
jgi:hypothetical protein